MKLGIDAREIQDGVYTGIGRSLYNFIKYFLSQNNDDQLVLFSSKKLRLGPNKRFKNIVIPGNIIILWDQVALPMAINQEQIDIFYSPYYKVPLNAKCIVVRAILDLMYIIYEKYKNNLNFFSESYYKHFGKLYADRSDIILTCSEYSKKDIINIFSVDPEKIKVIPLSVSDIYKTENESGKISAAKAKYGIEGRYIYYIGNFKHHKNVENLIIAFRKILPKFKDLKLVLAGPKTHLYQQYLSLIHVLSIQDSVIFTGKILPEDEPHLLYNGAEVFVFPSLYEGFGIPPIEAMACGTPVISSNLTSLPEVISSAGILVDPFNTDDLAAAISSILSNNSLKDVLIEKGFKLAKKFSQENVSKQYYEFFKKLLRNKDN